MITYYEHYPHSTGTMNTRVKMNEEIFALLLVLATSDDGDDMDLFRDLVDELPAKRNVKHMGPYAALDMFSNESSEGWAKKMVRRLQKKGFIVNTWEEGSFFIALPGFERDAMRKLIAQETEILMNDSEF